MFLQRILWRYQKLLPKSLFKANCTARGKRNSKVSRKIINHDNIQQKLANKEHYFLDLTAKNY